MVLSSQVSRTWKAATIVGTSVTGFIAVFQTDYSGPQGRDHVFSGLQRSYRKIVDEVFLGIPSDVAEKGNTPHDPHPEVPTK
mmetsp:Transcript_32714/g.75287  ORF Transcript_32714/g.75287 Transcript_32714/m.75287 type:complete len:82 (+) Transcript_32714:245-490(+)